jgi:hypothetical protein
VTAPAAPSRKGRRARVSLWLLAAVAPLLLIAQTWTTGADVKANADQPDVYVRLVNGVVLGNDGLLVPGRPGQAPVRATQKLFDTPSLNVFFNQTPLHLDVQNKSPGLWDIENGVVLALDGHSHRRVMPFTKAQVWKGNLLFRSEQAVTDVDDLSFAHGRIRMTPRRNASTNALRVNAFAPPADGATDQLLLYGHEPQPSGAADQPLARVERLGPALIVHAFVSHAVSIDGEAIGERTDAILPAGAHLRVTDGRRSAVFSFGGAAPSAISAWQPLTERVRDPRFGRFAEAFETAMSQAMAQGADVENKSVATSLDASLQARLQSALEAYMAPHGPHRAAVTVMDARTGEILALATWPAPSNDASPPLNADTSDPERNQNFYPMPIGSAAKPLMSEAILTVEPQLAHLQIKPGEIPITEILGVQLDAKIGSDHPLPGPKIDFNQFLQWSSNRFALSLLMLSATKAPDREGPVASDTYWIDNQAHAHLPPLLFDSYQKEDGTHLGALNGGLLPWAGLLSDYYGVDYSTPRHARPGDVGNDSYDMGVWSDLFALPQMRALPRPYLAALKDISPDREIFPTEDMRSFRGDFVQMILGGQEYPWTTIRLAQSYARIVTNHMVRASLMQRDPNAPLERSANIPPVAFSTVRAGMAAVVNGTGAKIRPDVDALSAMAKQRGETLGVWAKTGTPNLETAYATDAEAAIDDLIRERLLLLDGDRIVVAVKDSVPAQGAAGTRALASSRLGGALLRRHGVSAGAVIARTAAYNKGDRSGFEVKLGKLVLSRHTALRAQETRAFVFVVGRYAGSTDGDPKRALVVAINIQDNWADKEHVAAIFGHCILSGIIGPTLFEDPSLQHAPPAGCG